MAERTLGEVGEGLEIRVVPITALKEQDVNAQMMEPDQFDRMTENVRIRGAMESVPYCAQPGGEGQIEIVSGHHRFRAARAAGLTEIPVLVDTKLESRSEITAKQLAHNALVGTSVEAVVRQMLSTIEEPDHMLMTGLDPSMFPTVDEDALPTGTPAADFDWRMVSFTFLPHQLDSFDDLIKRMDAADLVGVAPVELFEDFAKALREFMRFREVRAVGTTVAKLTEMAKIALDRPELVAEWYDDQDGQAVDQDGWVPINAVVGNGSMPAAAAATVKRVIDTMVERGDVNPKQRWQALEFIAAEYEAGQQQAVGE
jgi:hypothetical protein